MIYRRTLGFLSGSTSDVHATRACTCYIGMSPVVVIAVVIEAIGGEAIGCGGGGGGEAIGEVGYVLWTKACGQLSTIIDDCLG